MFDIFSDIYTSISNLKFLSPSEYSVGYTRNVSYYDTFSIGYESGLKNWDVNGSVIWYFSNKKFFHELEFNSTKSIPSLNINDAKGHHIISAMGNITEIENISPDMAANMHEIRGAAILYGFYRNYPVDERTSMYLGSCLGIIKVLRFQGFRKNAEDLYGLVKGVKLGISHSLNTSLTAYMGYNYRKRTWKYKTDTIYDSEGNSIMYELLDFEFASHGIEVGIRFSN